MREIVIRKYKMKNIDRLRKWARFDLHFSGGMSNPNWSGYRMTSRDGGAVIIHLWPVENKQ